MNVQEINRILKDIRIDLKKLKEIEQDLRIKKLIEINISEEITEDEKTVSGRIRDSARKLIQAVSK